MNTSQVIGFLGLGNMGGPMAANLVKAGHKVRGFDPVEAARASAVANGIQVFPTLQEACSGAEIIVTMLPTGSQVLDAYGTDAGKGVAGLVDPGTLLIDCSTIDIADARAAHGIARAAGLRSVDAPVSGGVLGAAAGTLTFMVGGSDEDFALAEPILEQMGRRIVYCGGEGTGQAAKVCNNMILGISMIAVSEAFVLGEALGLTHDALYDVASTASGQCWALTSNCPVPTTSGPVSPASREYQPGFAAELMLKDLRLARDAAAGVAATSLGVHAQEQYERYVVEGGAGSDFSGIIRWIRDQGDAAPTTPTTADPRETHS
jgi:3-hydroxyisobutyrate dehydrogenase